MEELNQHQFAGDAGTPASAEESVESALLSQEDSLRDKLFREAGLIASQRTYAREGFVDAVVDVKENPSKLIAPVVGGALITAGFALAQRNPGALFGLARHVKTVGLVGGGAAGGIDLFNRVKEPIADTWESGDNMEENKRKLGRNLGELGFSLAAGGVAGYGTVRALGLASVPSSSLMALESKTLPSLKPGNQRLPALESGPLAGSFSAKALMPGRNLSPKQLSSGDELFALPETTVTHPDAPRLVSVLGDPVGPPPEPVLFLKERLRARPELNRLLAEGRLSESEIRATMIGRDLARLHTTTGQSLTSSESEAALARLAQSDRDLLQAAYFEEMAKRARFAEPAAQTDKPLSSRVIDTIYAPRAELLKERPFLNRLLERGVYTESEARALLIGEEHARVDLQSRNASYDKPALIESPEFKRLDREEQSVMLSAYREAISNYHPATSGGLTSKVPGIGEIGFGNDKPFGIFIDLGA